VTITYTNLCVWLHFDAFFFLNMLFQMWKATMVYY
jgi:hypothetical protein